MDKNPFSLYDFLGYAVPGAFTLIIAWCLFRDDPHFIIEVINKDFRLLELFNVKNLVVIIIISYVLGHLIAFSSSISIEKFALWCYEYPSKYLMSNNPPKTNYFGLRKLCNYRFNIRISRFILFFRSIENECLIQKIKKIFLKLHEWFVILNLLGFKLILLIILLPISILSLIFGSVFRFNRFVLKPLDPLLQVCILKKKNVLLERLDVINVYNENEKKLKNTEKDNLRIIYHYQYERQTKQARKMDNYVALYGFLRSLTLIFVMLFDYMLIKAILTIGKVSFNLDWKSINILIVLAIISYVFYLAFMKFFRRFTVECFMALVTDESLVDRKNKDMFIQSSTSYYK